jgi:type I restriction enzyme S subunit
MVPLRQILRERRESIRLADNLDGRQAITVKLTGEILPRNRATAFKGSMFAAYPGDLVFSRIDARNGAIGIVPDSIARAVVTTEYPVLIADPTRVRPDFLGLLLRVDHVRAELQRQASGTSGRKRVRLDGFLGIEVPLPGPGDQDALVGSYDDARARAAALEQEAQAVDNAGLRAFEDALGLAAPPPLPDRPMFIARFRDLERWSHDSVSRATYGATVGEPLWPRVPLHEALLEVRHGCSLGPSKTPTGLRVLKISSVTKGFLDRREIKHVADSPAVRDAYALRVGDILMCRTNGTLAYVGMSALVDADVPDTIFPDKVIRVRPDTSILDPTYLWRLLQTFGVRTQIEARARTAVGNYAIGGRDIRCLQVPIPPITEQRRLVSSLLEANESAKAKRAQAAALRQSAWAAFEAGLFQDGTGGDGDA